MSETWADAQFDMLEAAYDEVPIEAKARIAELERELAYARLAASEETKPKCDVCDRTTLLVEIEGLRERGDELDELIRDMWAGIVREHPQGGFPDMGLMEKRMRELGIEVKDEG